MAAARKGRTTNIFVWIILGLLIIGLMGFGIGNFTGTTNRLGSVGSTEIEINRYVQVYQNVLQNLLAGNPELAGSQIVTDEASRLALGIVTEAAAIVEETRQMGLSVGDRSVLERLREFPAFRNLEGTFSNEAYEFYLERNGLTQAEFDEILREEETRSLLTGIVSRGFNPMPVWEERVVAYLLESRDIRWAEVTDAMVDADRIQGNAAAHRQFYDDNPDLFTQPERRELTYAWVSPAMISGDIIVSESELRELYQEQIDQYVKPERRVVDRLVFENMDTAREAAGRVAGGDITFDDLLAERGILVQDIELGAVAADGLSESSAEAVFGAEGLSVVGPVESAIGPALFRINGILGATDRAFEDVRDELRKEQAMNVAVRQIADRFESYNDLLAEGATLEVLVDETEMEIGTLSYDDGSEAEILDHPEFRLAAGSVSGSDFPEILPLSDGGAFALRLDGITEPRLLPIAEVEERVAVLWKDQAIRERKLEVAGRVAESLSGNADFASAGFEVTELTEGVSRGGAVPGAPAGMAARAFELDTGGAGIVGNDDQVVIMRVENVNAADSDSIAVQNFRTLVAGNVSRLMSGNAAEQYASHVAVNSDLRIDGQVLNSVNAQLQAQYATAP